MEKEAKDAQTWPDAAPPLAQRRAAFGGRLAAAREGRGLTAVALAQVTRIGAHFIAALEAGAFEKLPGEVFGRGYVRCICKNLGVEAADLVAEYDELWEKVTPRSVLKVEIKSRPTKERNEALVSLAATAGSLLRSGIVLKLAVPVVAGVGLVYALVATPLLPLLTRRLHGTAAATQGPVGAPPKTLSLEGPAGPEAATAEVGKEAPPPAAALVPAAGAPAPGAAQAAAAVAAPVARAASGALAAAGAPGGAAHEQVLELVVTEPVRIKIDVDQGRSVMKELAPDSYRFTFQQKAEMMVYDAAAVKISFNGRALGSLGGKGRVRKLSFQADGPTDKKL